MDATRFAEANVILKGPEGREDIHDLYAYRDEEQTMFTSVWQPTAEELELLNQGQPVCLSVLGAIHPPVKLWVPTPAPQVEVANDIT